jgi:hypothetical protein
VEELEGAVRSAKKEAKRYYRHYEHALKEKVSAPIVIVVIVNKFVTTVTKLKNYNNNNNNNSNSKTNDTP